MVLNLPFDEGDEIIQFAIKEEEKDKMFFRWAVGYQSQMSFADFENQIKKKIIDDGRSAEDILNEVEKMMMRF